MAIIDYGAGNVKSIKNILLQLGAEPVLTSDPEVLINADKIIFPGQGHFAQCMEQLQEKGLDVVIKDVISQGKHFLGICLGLQVLFEESEEAEGVQGLSIFKGKVKKFTQGNIPQVGWNRIEVSQADSALSNDYFYFVNSYYVVPDDEKIISSKTEYHIDFCSSVKCKNVSAVQFHPEKSADAGINFFKKWLEA
ncbi:imidazole glycerol phosphate synthase subunit HisH [bacterium]|nr:imidazole glycerol phosphate synthase subunit HisH [bacterium]